ncbi:MAG: right-handed parallel beta-helix repeat-containing protein [Thermoplasmata archaeon]|nr:right-handed parallel beta-helix repeat-containing protein [Thermoplasmata archaeon]
MRKAISLLVCSVLASTLIFVLVPRSVAGTTVDTDVMADTTWTEAGSPYVIMKTIHVAQGSTLTVEEGASVEFDGFYSIVVDGTLLVNGTNVKAVTFTSGTASPSPGDWDHIKFTSTSSSNVLQYVDIFYARTGLYAEQSSFDMANSSISHSLYKGIDAFQSYSSIRDSTITHSGIGVKVYQGSAHISGNVLTQNTNGVDLTASDAWIEGNEITYNGMGIVLNDSSSQIINNDISFNEEGIVAQSASHPFIEGNEIHANAKSGIWCVMSNAEISENIVSDNTIGIEADDSTLTVSENIIRFNFVGLGLDDGSTLEVVDSSILQSTQYSFELETNSHATSINSTFEMTKVSVDGTSTLIVKNYLTVMVENVSGYLIGGASVNISDEDDGGNIHTEYSGEDGLTEPRLMTDRVYSGSSIPTNNPTHVVVFFDDLTFIDNPRDVDMSSTHVETFTELEVTDGDGSNGGFWGWLVTLAVIIVLAIVSVLVFLLVQRRRKDQESRSKKGRRKGRGRSK